MYITARAEFDQPDALALGHFIARFLVTYDAACDQAGDLFEGHGRALAPHRDNVLFVIPRALLAAGHPLSRPDGDFPLRSEMYITARAEFDQPDALALGHFIARFLVTYDAACDQAASYV